MRAVDTNVLIRIIAQDDPQQEAAARRFIQKGAWISHHVLIEVSWLLRSRYARSQAEIAAIIAALLETDVLIFQDEAVVISALRLFRSKPSLKFSDCMILEIARKAGHSPLATFDRDLARIPGAELLSSRA